jgi:hypothetical protein
MGEYRHKLSFGASHRSADLSRLPELLGMPSSVLWRVGEPCKTPKGKALDRIADTSYCSIRFEMLDGLPQSLEAAVAALTPHKSYLDGLSDSGGSFRFFIGWFSESWNTGERLNWTLLRDIADLRIALDFDVYGPGEGGV